MTKLLSDRIKELRLKPDAPFPSEILDAHEAIRIYRLQRRFGLVNPDGTVRDNHSDGFVGHTDDGETP